MHGTDALITHKNSTSHAASDGNGGGDDGGAVLKTLKSRKATLAFDTPSQVVIDAYNHEDMLDTSDELHEVPVHGTYLNKVWTSGNGGSKVTNRNMRIIPSASRDPRRERNNCSLCGYLRGRHPACVYAGQDKVNEVSFADNTESFDSRNEPPNVVAGINTIFHEGCTVLGNISWLQRFVKDKVTVFEEQPAPLARLVRQNNRVLQYLPVEPLQNLKVNDDAGRQPSHRTLYHGNGIDTHWMYHATPLGIVEPPQEPIDRLNVFLSTHYLDSTPTNPAVHVVYLYFMAKKSDNLESEVFGRMPAVDLEMTGQLGWRQMGGIGAQIRLKLALRLGKKLEDLIYDRNQMVFKWDGIFHEVMNAMTKRSLPSAGDIESLMTNGTTT
ncbi:hypothetical protein FDENT_11559 [Fusarium denticulatum]|uniref:Uncharacterized protein n=1 Tax=Fusarium denticulatum TaxID=48507 RepID=A0A8H5TJ25_9HYPO|nr:hypothetical protein FDENT_11559 [Fusarium denticulatum]